VSEGPDYKVLVDEGKEHEKRYDWILAVEPYEKALTLAVKRNDFSQAAKTCERIGFCQHRAAMQARNVKEFRNRKHQAFNSYSRAVKLIEKSEDQEKLAKICHCRAAAAYINSSCSPDVATRKKLLDECWKLEKEALRFYKEIGNRHGLGKTYNELNTFLVDRLNLEWNNQKRQEAVREALSYGYKAIDLLSELGEEHELARAYYTTSIYCNIAAQGLELEKKSKYAREALSYSKKAVELSQQIGDHFLLGMSSIRAGSAIANFTDRPDSAAEHFEEALECGTRTRDNYLIGRASYLLAYLMAWKMIAEEDPEKIREESEKCEKHSQDAIRHFKSISNNQEIASSYYWYAENYGILAGSAETSLKKRRNLLRKSIEAAQKGLEYAQLSGSIDAMWFILHPLSKSLFLLSTMETDADIKKQLLEKSLRYREENIEALEQAMPYYFWNQGVYHNYLALIQAELAKIESNEKQKTKLLEDAIENAEGCINLCLKAGSLSQGQYATLGKYYSDFGGILDQLHMITGSPELLDRLLNVLRGAVKSYAKADLPSRAAESYWQLAKVHDKLRDFEESAETFELAHDQYAHAVERIPSLKSFYLNHAAYMRGWSEIQKARHYHARREYYLAEKHYEKAASLHKSSKSWQYLVSDYLAWAQLERGENLSQGEQPEQARGTFQQAAGLFAEAKKSIELRLESIRIREEKAMAADLVKASDMRREYCLGRAALEEAKILDKKGDHSSSSEKYGSAAQIFERLTQASELDQDRRELQLITILARAWQKMTQAEAEASPSLYLDASQLFEQAKDFSPDEKAKMLALGHSRFCLALEAGTKFADTRDASLHKIAEQHLESAANYYVKTGFRNASEYAKATELLLDAYLYMDKALEELNPEQKAKLYMMAERVLQSSASSFMKAEHQEKREQVLRLAKKAKEERELAVSLTEMLHAPSTFSPTTAFPTPTQTHENSVGLERFEHADIQANVITRQKELKMGENLHLRVELINAGKYPAFLTKISDIVPESFDLIEEPRIYNVEDGDLNMKGKQLKPLKAEEINIVLRPLNKGTFTIRPRVIYLDEDGHQMSSEPEPGTIDVSEVHLPSRVSTGFADLDDLLLGGLPENRVVLMSSPSCDERDMLIRGFLETGVKKGEATFYLTIDASGIRSLATDYPANFYVFVCNPKADENIENLPNVFKLRGVENLTEISIALTSAFRRLDPGVARRACIVIISDVLLLHGAPSARRWLAALIPELRSNRFTTLAVMNPRMHPSEVTQAILDLFDGEIDMYEKETKRRTEKMLKIKRLYDQKYLDTELPLRKERLMG